MHLICPLPLKVDTAAYFPFSAYPLYLGQTFKKRPKPQATLAT